MNKLLEKFAIDPLQFRALLRLSWRLDMRQSRMGFGFNQKGKKPIFIFLISIIFYFAIGVIFAQTAFQAQDPFVGGLVVGSILMLLIGGIMLVEFNSVVIVPEDFHVLGYLPVSSRTYFFSKVANLLFFTSLFTAVLGLPSLVVFAFRSDLPGLSIVCSLIAIALTSFMTTLTIIALYSYLQKKLLPAVLKRALSYLQFTLTLFIYLGYLILPKILISQFKEVTLERSWWYMLLPPAWSASMLNLGLGIFSPMNLVGALLLFLSVILLYKFVSSQISLDYAKNVAAMLQNDGASASKSPSKATTSKWFAFGNAEQRIIFKLLHAQFRHDLKFRFSFLAVLPLLLVYFYLGSQNGQLLDPFTSGSAGMERFGAFFFAILMLPMLMKNNIEASDSYDASWIFYTTASDLSRLVRATKNALFLLFSLPALVLVVVILGFAFANWLNAGLHAITLAMLSFLILQLVYISNPKLPFSEPKTKGSKFRAYFLLFILLPAIGLGLLHILVTLFYNSWQSLLQMYFYLFLAIVFFEWLVRKRVRIKMARYFKN